MATLRKMLGTAESPYIVSLMRIIETQSKDTIARWCLGYAQKHILPIYEKAYPQDNRARNAILAAREWLAGNIKLPEAKQHILACHAAAREAETNPAGQAAARAVAQAASVIHMPSHSLGLAFYGAAAIEYDRAGTGQSAAVYEQIAAEECAKMEAALRDIAAEGEPHPAKIKWRC